MGTPTQTQTNVVSYGSELQRKGWLLEGLLQAKANSLFSGFRGSSSEAVIFVKSDLSKGAGHEVVFQFNGKATGAAKRGKQRLRGNEEQKKLFSDKIRVERLRHGLDNGDEFDAVNVDNLAGAQHGDSRGLLANWYIEQRDQAIIDAGQGFLNSEEQTHVIRPDALVKGTAFAVPADSGMSYDFILECEQIVKDGGNFGNGSKTAKRIPLEPISLIDGKKKFVWFIDSMQAKQMRQESTLVTLFTTGDVRGSDNSLIKGVVGSLGIFLFVELPTYMGKAEDRGMYGTDVEVVGMRKYNTATSKYSGEEGAEDAGQLITRSFIVGKKAFQEAFGKMPNYIFKSSEDYDIDTGSAIELWAKTQKCILAAENEDYHEAVVAGYNYGLIGVETFHSTIA